MNIQHAKWIWTADAESGMQYRSFLAEFDAETDEAVLEISCDTCYALYLNGKFAGIGGLSDYPDRKIFETRSLKNNIGHNRLFITVYHEGKSSSCYRLGIPCLKFAVSDGEKLLCRSDENTLCADRIGYQHKDVPQITGQLGYSFAYSEPEEAVTFRKNAKLLDIDPILLPRPIKPLSLLPEAKAMITAQGVFTDDRSQTNTGERMQRAYLSSRDLSAVCKNECTAPLKLNGTEYIFSDDDGDGIYLIVDLCEESVGLFTLDIALEQKTLIDIGWGEHLDDLRTRTSVGGRNFAASVTLNAGRKQFTHYFRRMGLRYLQLHIHAHTYKLYYAGILPTEYPLTLHPIRRKDHLEQRINDICVRTLKHCMHDHYEDCPWREQALYTMDSRNQMLCSYYCFEEYDFAKYSLQLAAHSLRQDGLLELCSPGEVAITIPAFTLIFLKQIEEYLLYSKDKATAKELFKVGQQILDGFIARADQNGLIQALPRKEDWNFYEWQTGLEGKIFSTLEKPRYDAPLCGYYGIALQAGANIAKQLSMNEKATQYKAAFELLKQNTDPFFWDEEKQYYQSFIYADGEKTDHFAQLTGSLLLYAGLVPENKADAVREKLLHSDALYPVTLSHSIYRYEALLQDEKNASAVKEEILDIWGKMVFSGADTFWETADGAWAFENAGSLCHGWSAVPLYIYAKYGLENE